MSILGKIFGGGGDGGGMFSNLLGFLGNAICPGLGGMIGKLFGEVLGGFFSDTKASMME